MSIYDLMVSSHNSLYGTVGLIFNQELLLTSKLFYIQLRGGLKILLEHFLNL
jgi:hypothetical protein